MLHPYCLNMSACHTCLSMLQVLSATPQSVRDDGFTDEGMSAVIDLGGGVKGTFEASLRHSGLLPVIKFIAKGTG